MPDTTPIDLYDVATPSLADAQPGNPFQGLTQKKVSRSREKVIRRRLSR